MGLLRQRTMHSQRESPSIRNDIINSFCITKEADKVFFGNADGTIKVLDIQTSFTLEKAVFAYKSVVRWFGTSKCGKYLGTVGLTLDSYFKLADTLKIWDL